MDAPIDQPTIRFQAENWQCAECAAFVTYVRDNEREPSKADERLVCCPNPECRAVGSFEPIDVDPLVTEDDAAKAGVRATDGFVAWVLQDDATGSPVASGDDDNEGTVQDRN